ncbi:MAG: glutaminyl-peptide cyclotransferase [Candidatus Electrothrix sp. AUS1_2]|nr:glutaminyl-peptide cyclotransferase [Candidatus Electrothrix sp. AUS1_2]
MPARPPSDAPPVLSVAIVHRYPHDRKAFTQGLVWDRGTVYEGTGLYGRSSLRRVDLESGRIKQQREYNRQIFAEGVTVFQDAVYQLTWKNNLVFQYDKKDLSQINSWKYPRQGWGLTHDGQSLIASDGTADLFFLDPETLSLQGRITVYDDRGEVDRLNELEYIKGSLYANVWMTERIAVISPETGRITTWLDLSPICRQIRAEDKQADVLNGIMYDPATDRLFVTGKLWPALFEIRVIPAGKEKRRKFTSSPPFFPFFSQYLYGKKLTAS